MPKTLDYQLRKRFFQVACFFLIAMFGSGGVVYILIDISKVFGAVLLLSACVPGMILLRFKRTKEFENMTWVLIVVFFGVDIIGWFLLDGLSGSGPIMFVMAILMSCTFIRFRRLKYFLPIVAFLYLVMIVLWVNYNELFAPYQSDLIEMQDKVFIYVLAGALSCSILLAYRQKIFQAADSILEARALRIKNKDLEESVQFKTDFLAQISHEIRTPLNAIVGTLDILDAENTTHSKEELKGMMRESAQDLMHIVDEVLNLSKLESGNFSLQMERTNLDRLCSHCISLYSGRALEKKNDLSYFIEEDVQLEILTDPQRLKQIIINLLSNANKFTSNGSVRLTVQRSKANAGKYEFAVEDTGIGIEDSDFSTIFMKYGQVGEMSSAKKQGKILGTGLGLAISNELAKLMGGEGVVVKSKIGVGSRFSFLINAQEVQSDKEIAGNNTGTRAEVKKFNENQSVLVVEDVRANQLVLSSMLKSLGGEFKIANNGQEAVDLMDQENNFTLVLMDIQMPVMDGIDATKELRKRHDTLPPIIALSANAMEGDEDKYKKNGFDGYISKPITREKLLEGIGRVIGKMP